MDSAPALAAEQQHSCEQAEQPLIPRDHLAHLPYQPGVGWLVAEDGCDGHGYIYEDEAEPINLELL